MQKTVKALLGIICLCGVLLSGCRQATTGEETTLATTTASTQTSLVMTSTTTETSTKATTETPEPSVSMEQLDFDLETVQYKSGEICLTVAWGSEENELGYWEVAEISRMDGPQSFTMTDDETFYIYDSYNQGVLKAFRAGKLVNALSLKGKADFEDIIGISQMVYIGGSIFAYCNTTNGIYKITGENVEKLNIHCEGGMYFTELRHDPDGTLFVSDYMQSGGNYKQTGVRQRRFDTEGNLLSTAYGNDRLDYNNKLSFILLDHVEFVEKETKMQFALINSEGELQKKLELAIGEKLPKAEGGLYTETTLKTELGRDKKDRIYLEIQRDYREENGQPIKKELFLARLSIKDGTIEAIRIPVPTEDEIMGVGGAMSVRSGMYPYTILAADDSIFKSYMSAADGVSILRFVFD